MPVECTNVLSHPTRQRQDSPEERNPARKKYVRRRSIPTIHSNIKHQKFLDIPSMADPVRQIEMSMVPALQLVGKDYSF